MYKSLLTGGRLWLSLLLLCLSFGHVFSQVSPYFGGWEISSDNLTNGRIEMTPNQKINLVFTVVASRPDIVGYSFTFKLFRMANAGPSPVALTDELHITPADFGDYPSTRKQFTVSLTAAAGTSFTGTTLRNGDQLFLGMDGEWDSGKNYYNVFVDNTITNNKITAPATSTFINIGDPGSITGSTPGGGNGPGSYQYQWESSTTGVETDFHPIAGTDAKGLSYDPPQIDATQYYRRVVTSSTYTSYSNIVAITIKKLVENNIISYAGSTYLEGGWSAEPAVISGIAGYAFGATITYQWQLSTADAASGFSDIVSATNLNFDPSSINLVTYYRRVAKATGYEDTPSNVIKLTPITSNSISFTGASGSDIYYYQRTITPPLMTGTPMTEISGAPLPFQYAWFARTDVNGSTWSRIYAPADGLSCQPEWILESTVYQREVLLYIDGKEVFVSESPEIRAHVSDPIDNNTICCDQVVTGLATPAVITGSVATGGYDHLTYFYQISTDGSTWDLLQSGTYINNGTGYQMPAGLKGKFYIRRFIRDGAPFNTPGSTNASNVITVTYNNADAPGSTFQNAFKTASFDNNCGEFVKTVNTLDGSFVNNYGDSGNDAYFQFTVTGNTVMGFVACGSSVATKFYLFDASFNAKAMSYSQNYCNQYANLTPGTYYLIVEGSGSIRLHMGTYVYSDCQDGYDQGPLNPPSGFSSSSVDIFPNPAADNVQINLSDDEDTSAKTVVIYNKNNIAVKRFDTRESTLQISVADLPSDIYIVDIVARGGSRKQRLVVK